ncbi:MAG: hypothetical protein ACKVZ0_04685 [Gemmatimonadales bacterium]
MSLLYPTLLTILAIQGGTAVHGLVIPYPSSWQRIDDPSGKVTLVPDQVLGVQPYYLAVMPPSRQIGTPWESHKALLGAVLAQVPWTEDPVTRHHPDGPGPFIRTSIAGRVASGGLQSIELYSAAHDGIIEAVIGINGLDHNVVDPVLRRVVFRSPPKPVERPRIVEAYRRLDQKKYPDTRGGAPIAGTLMYERIWLRADGVADFSTNYPEGYGGSPLPLKVDPGLMDGDYGRWKAVGDQVHIERHRGSAPAVYQRENDGLKDGGGVWWAPMPRVDDLKLAGRWSMRSPPGETASPYYDWIEFRPDGTFATDGVLRHVAFGVVSRPQPPQRGAGTYRIRDWTIVFTFADGSTWSTDFSTVGPGAPGASSIILRTTAYSRER